MKSIIKSRPQQSALFQSLRILTLAILLFAVWPSVHAAFTYDPALQWYTLQTEHFEIHYHDGEEQVAMRAAQISEKQYQRLTTYFDWYR